MYHRNNDHKTIEICLICENWLAQSISVVFVGFKTLRKRNKETRCGKDSNIFFFWFNHSRSFTSVRAWYTSPFVGFFLNFALIFYSMIEQNTNFVGLNEILMLLWLCESSFWFYSFDKTCCESHLIKQPATNNIEARFENVHYFSSKQEQFWKSFDKK